MLRNVKWGKAAGDGMRGQEAWLDLDENLGAISPSPGRWPLEGKPTIRTVSRGSLTFRERG